MSVRIKWNVKPDDLVKNLRKQLERLLDDARLYYAEFLYDELVRTSPVDTSTFKRSWQTPVPTAIGYSIVNALPEVYQANGKYHRKGQTIPAPYNIFLLEGRKAGAPEVYGTTNHTWEYMNRPELKLQDVNILLWRFNQGALGLNPYTLLNTLFASTVRRNL